VIGVLGAKLLHVAQPVAFDDADLATGVLVYTPRAAGEVVIEAWPEIVAAFDGTTPTADVAQFGLLAPGAYGWKYASDGNQWDASVADVSYLGDDYLTADQSGFMNGGLSLIAASGTSGYRVAPGRLASAEPVRVIVTQDGTKGGAAVGGTAGLLLLHLLIARG
jgi:hypothetical protein